uniref:Uncharacterized protein n=1 Tax=Hucho hucho TaxID=62062 RepID=A0A4W5N2L9_9TELE
MERVQQSNEACQRGDFQAALSLYGDALRADPQNCILYSNRSAAFHKLGRYQAALDDAVKARLLNPKWPKVSLSEPPTINHNTSLHLNKQCEITIQTENRPVSCTQKPCPNLSPLSF